MNNKHKLFMAALQEDMREFLKADIGKVARADLKAIEKAEGGKKKLDQAAKVLADADVEAKKIVADARAVAANIENEVAAEIGQRTSSLNKHEQKLKARETSADERDYGLNERTTGVKERERLVVERAAACHERENANANTMEALEAEQSRLTAWERALDVRAVRIKEALDVA